MTTLDDVVNALIDQTKAGAVEWKPNNWEDDGNPRRWSGHAPATDCTFDLMGSHATLNMLDGQRWITLGSGYPVDQLVSIVASTSSQKGTTREEALQKALSCLTPKSSQ